MTQPDAGNETNARGKKASGHDYAVTVRDLTRMFGEFVAVDNVSFDVKRGEIFGFLGANGAGKTTTIKMLTGLLRPTSGTGTVDGLDISNDRRAIKSRIGYMSQRFSLYDDLKVEENLFFFGGVYGMDRDSVEARVSELDDMLSLSGLENRMTASLPPGHKQRLALACAILHRPPVLFLDEPTGGVDPVARRYFWDLISTIASDGTTVFVTTHYMDEAEYCHRLSIMHAGRIVEVDSPARIKEKHGMTSIQDVFIKLVDG
ncbi:MAG: ABC transporter ATP-binding protein [Desulfococcus sp. 4484_241]|nr:MAG: ABC transporter ATP-binding protein [Desulfococcus sp. 4484_241]RLC28896.1 MAG: ABC transporter ATP-binding protein [Deltaproteobacteria bacterium]